MSTSKSKAFEQRELFVRYLSDSNFSHRDFCVQLATHYPMLFVRLADKITGSESIKTTHAFEQRQAMIRYLCDELLPHKDICIAAAMQSPTIFVRVANKTSGVEGDRYMVAQGADGRQVRIDKLAPWYGFMLKEIAAGQIIQAIKRMRAETGLGLKEAKDYVDRLRGTEPDNTWPR